MATKINGKQIDVGKSHSARIRLKKDGKPFS